MIEIVFALFAEIFGALLLEVIIGIVAIYASFYRWIKVRDIQSNEKADFFLPAGFLAFGLIVAFSMEIQLFSLFYVLIFLPLFIALMMTGLAQDKQKLDGDLTYNEGDRFWVILDEGGSLTPDQAAFIGKEGEIDEVNPDRTVSMTFAGGSEAEIPIQCLSNTPPNSEKPKNKGWWTK